MQLMDFLQLKLLVFTREDANEDPKWFFGGSKKAYVTLGCSNVRRVELVTYQLRGKVDEWWATWREPQILHQ